MVNLDEVTPIQNNSNMYNDIISLQNRLIQSGYLDNSIRDGKYVEADGIYGPKTDAAYKRYIADSSNKSVNRRLMSFDDIKNYEKEINKLSNEDIITYYHSLNKDGKPYIVDDKTNNKLRVYVNGQLIREYNAIHGKYSTTFGNTYKKPIKQTGKYIVQSGDYLGKIAKQYGTTVDALAKQNNITNPNLIRPGQEIDVSKIGYVNEYVDPDEMTKTVLDDRGKLINLAGNLTTPAGVYFTNKTTKYNGAPAFIRQTNEQLKSGNKNGIPASIHARTILEGANTNGCTGLDKRDLEDLNNIIKDNKNVKTYILPANNKNKFTIRNGKLTFKSHNVAKTPSYNEMDYSPISQIRYSSKNLTDENKKIISEYATSLIKNKEKLQKELRINNDTYNELVKLSLGILGVETNYGNKNSAVGNTLRLVNKIINNSNSSPDYYSKYHTYGIKGDNNSVGLTQIRWKYLGEEEREILKNNKISKEDLVNSPKKAAIATLVKLASEYKRQGYDYNKAVSSWNKNSNYLNRVKKASNRFNIYQYYKL